LRNVRRGREDERKARGQPRIVPGEAVEIIVAVSGGADIAQDKAFETVLSVEPDGRWVLDYRQFHGVRDAAPTSPH